MIGSLLDSYARCEVIARKSGSSFFASFALLGQDRRNAMTALYAFARLADDATDDKTFRNDNGNNWSAEAWHVWLDSLSSTSAPSDASTVGLGPIRIALADSVSKFSIPLETLHDIVHGVNTDAAQSQVGPSCRVRINSVDATAFPLQNTLESYPPIRMKDWDETKVYCHRVASSVGIACLSIWAKTIGEPASPAITQAALDCGVAFQMTNILRDIAEDSLRNRIYLPEDEFARFGIDTMHWLGLQAKPTLFALNELGDWRGMIRLQIERAKAMSESGWQVADSISLDSQRMFSLIWHSYRQLLSMIEKAPELVWQTRVRLTKANNWQLVGQHLFTPAFKRLISTKKQPIPSDSNFAHHDWPAGGLRVAVIGSGLAGINAAMHLARHGCRVSLLESKHRIGGRVGSFVDAESGQSVDYCQHVGMNCCSTLKQWIEDTDQSPYWTEQDALHFVSSQGKRIRVTAWPLPVPMHLLGLLWRWPQLELLDRIRIGVSLLRLKALRRDNISPAELAIDWLRANGQDERCIQNFWCTILVSALGEQVDRVSLTAVHKVLIDGFASHRNAFHLLVPNRPLSELLVECVSARLLKLGVTIRLGKIVNCIVKIQSNSFQLKFHGETGNSAELYDVVVCAVPWNKVSEILPREDLPSVQGASLLESSPITGIHTWWDRSWLKEPHAILVNRLCQWVFPGPESHQVESSAGLSNRTREHYYQIVISASRTLPTGDSDVILKMVKQDLAEIFPEASVATLLRGRVVTDPNAVFSVTAGHNANRPNCSVLRDRKIWLAGDWTATQWPATMEGALRSGALAAQDLLGAFGRNASLIEKDVG